MTVIILTACPPGLRGHLTQWLLELTAGVYVGHISTRVRDRLWTRVTEMAGVGRALMVYQIPGEQRLSFVARPSLGAGGSRWGDLDASPCCPDRQSCDTRRLEQSGKAPPVWEAWASSVEARPARAIGAVPEAEAVADDYGRGSVVEHGLNRLPGILECTVINHCQPWQPPQLWVIPMSAESSASGARRSC
ncbi:type I-E CRISPR-associated endoribonuclease Cas2e [Micromonospora sp. M12]